MRKISLLIFVALVTLLAAAGAVPPQEGPRAYDAMRVEAEKHYAEKSFARANAIYAEAARLQLSEDEKRWVTFRIADTAWRADAAAPDNDPTKRDAARTTLETLARVEPRDRVRAEANESLGDYYNTHPWVRQPYQSQRFYVEALDWWAGSDDLTYARKRYLAMVWKMADTRYGMTAPRHVVVNAVKIAESTDDRARARYLLAQSYLTEGTPSGRERAFELFAEVVAMGRQTDWYDDALYQWAAHLVDDYPKALRLFRRLVSEFAQSESEWVDNARNAIDEITNVAVTVGSGDTFLPDSEQEILLGWRNTKQIELTLYAIDLTRDAKWNERKGWIEAIAFEGRSPARRWTYETNDTGDHRPGSTTLEITPKLATGAYVLTARAGSASNRTLILVTDAHILVHSVGGRAHVFVSDVETGKPIAGATVRVTGNGRRAIDVTGKTNAEGLADVALGEGGSLLFTAAAGARQAYHPTWSYGRSNDGRERHWRIYAFTDRPAYRPDETMYWKILARVRDDDRWETPAGESLAYEIVGPRGEKVSSGTAKLNAFGSFWSELALTPSMALGPYTINFKSGDRQAASAQLFRLEEYKLPEFSVAVATPEGTQYRLGDTIEATIDAAYYFGGPVANAEVEAVVYQQPFVRYWNPWRVYDWYWHDFMPRMPESVMTRETLRTDATGRAILRIPTPRDGNDMSYRIEARVVDASRREVRGEGSVRVTRQRYTVMAFPEHFIHRPGDPVSVKFRAVDANEKPVRTTGTVVVTKRRWKDRRYIDEEVMTTKLDTDVDGEATLTFTPKTVGYYSVKWTSPDGEGNRVRDIVTAETTVWVADRNTTDIGYYQTGGVQLIIDKEALRSGETANVIVVTPSSGRWVMFTSSATTIHNTQILHLDGTAKLVQFPIDDRHVPNFFLTASSVFDRQLATDSERVVVPPVEHFLTVEVKSDREQYEPRQEGTLTITTRDVDGKPVPAEVAVSLSDEAVTAIQADLAGDPRRFFFGDSHGQHLVVSGSAQNQRYRRLSEEKAVEEREAKEQDGAVGARVRRERGDLAATAAGYAVGAVSESITVTSMAPQMAPPPPPAVAAPVAPPSPEVANMKMAVGMVGGAASAPNMEVQVRSDFRSTALWKPDVVTDANGTATVKVKFPEALTTWRATARAATSGSSFGMGSSTSRTNLPLLVRLQGPRFFVVGDRATISGVINNNTDEAITVTPALEAEGLTVNGTVQPLRVEAHSDARADWIVTAERPGTAKLRVTARGARHGDAMEKSFVVYEHGIDKLIARSGKMRGDETVVRLELPRERRATDLTVQIAPSLATTMLDALPYLIEFPYGCTEQTMSRFLPAVVVARTLTKLGLDPNERIPKKNLDAVTAAGMARLYDMQHGDGGWGWWKEGSSDDFMTAYVVWGFALSREAGLRVDTGAVNRGATWLQSRLAERRRDPNDQAWMLHALAAWNGSKSSAAERTAYDNIWTNREKLSAFGRALLALIAHRYADTERTAILVRNLEDGVKLERAVDDEAESLGTAHWGSSQRFWWRWHEGPVETTAFVLRALVNIDPKHRLVEPAMNWLVKNRRGAQWNNTRDTAVSLLALNDYLERSGELRGNVTYELMVNGKVIATKSITAAEVLRAPSRFSIDDAVLRETTQEIRIRRTSGTAPLYFAAEGRFVSLEEPVKAAGNEIYVRREYFRLRERPTLLKGVLYDKVPLRDGESIKSGERLEVLVTVDSKNDYSYLMFEDLKPGGFEAVALQSGQPLYATQSKTRASTYVYQELRDRKVAMFIDHLAQGVWEIRYTLRAETPGHFHALPLLGQAMYVPEVKANGDEVRVVVGER
ncbi:MAG TPA: MG2 domain-containing protein [Thermoanaerobaculia bacterium]|nr:MG2 domain-containing protein [Thermoanaerobaculia bacterium]